VEEPGCLRARRGAGLAGAGPSLSRAVAAFSTMLDQPGVIVALGVAAAALALFSGNEAVE
jgi:hypothetical protein